MIEAQMRALRKLNGRKVEAGWFESNLYQSSDGKMTGISVARVARIQETGGVITHPGGTKYIKDAIVGKGDNARFVGTRFVKKDFQGDHEVTAPHDIEIPARPFMRLAAAKFAKSRQKVQASIAKQLAAGKISPDQGMAQIGLAMEGCIGDSIKNGGWQPNAPSTIAKKGFDKPLIDSSQMFQTISSKVS